MKGFIEVHSGKEEKPVLINVNHIVNVIGSHIFTDDIPPFAVDYTYTDCVESYEEIKALIANAVE